jgi:TRAP-type C4-dicarboxylate transport system substrate-binding protein
MRAGARSCIIDGMTRDLLIASCSAALLAFSAAGCGGGAVDKVGSPVAKPLVLTLAAHDDDEGYGTFAAAVDRLSHGSIRIRIAENWRVTGTRRELDYERGIVGDVRSGKLPLGIVGVRVWDTLGVESFQALVAPFLVESLALEGRALRSPLVSEALAGVRRDGVVGIALLPGRLRRPLGITGLLRGPADYRGQKIAIRIGAVAEATFRALRAMPKPFIPVDFTGFDGAEIDPLTVTQNGWDQGVHGLTANVAFWPKPQTILMNRKAFAALTPQQRRILAQAGREALAPELARIARDQRLGISILCGDAGFRLATATPADAAALRKAVQPVYERIERNPLTRRWITQIARERTPPDVVTCRTAGR